MQVRGSQSISVVQTTPRLLDPPPGPVVVPPVAEFVDVAMDAPLDAALEPPLPLPARLSFALSRPHPRGAAKGAALPATSARNNRLFGSERSGKKSTGLQAQE